VTKSYQEIVGDGGSDILGQVTQQVARLRSRMDRVKHKVAICSGKGGVGKSFVTSNLALALASRGHEVGVLDADLNGASTARMLGVGGETLRVAPQGAQPAMAAMDIRVVSMDMLLPPGYVPLSWQGPASHQFVWRGTMEASAMREFLADVDWGELDMLLLDMPPGAEHLTDLADLLPGLAGIVAVTIPSAAAQPVVGRCVARTVELKLPVLGVVENMAGYLCPSCGSMSHPFGVEGAGRELAAHFGVPFLGGIPFDPAAAAATDGGSPFVVEHRDSPVAAAFRGLAAQVWESIEGGRP
jgi:ATP-binding protein involved in chromosome partitioning